MFESAFLPLKNTESASKLACKWRQYRYLNDSNPREVGALFTTVSSIRVSRIGRVSSVSRVRVTLTVTVRVSRVSIMVIVSDAVK